jgi:hypothetical protein
MLMEGKAREILKNYYENDDRCGKCADKNCSNCSDLGIYFVWFYYRVYGLLIYFKNAGIN